MTTQRFRLGAVAAVVAMTLLPGPSAHAQDQDRDRFKHAIDGFVAQIAPTTSGLVRWAGSDPIEIRRDGDALVAAIDNARLVIGGPGGGDLKLDRLEIRELGRKDAGKLIELGIALPNAAVLRQPDGTRTRVTIADGKADAVIEADTGRGREQSLSFRSARIEQPKTGASIGFGPLSLASKLIGEANGGWSGPVDFELKGIVFSLPQAAVGGAVDHIAYHGTATGPSLARLQKLRDAAAALRSQAKAPPAARLAALLALLPALSGTFSTAGFDGAIDGVELHDPKGRALASVAQARIATAITGLDGKDAAIRIGIRYNGLDIAKRLLPEDRQPHRLVVDVGVGDLDTAAVHDLIGAAAAGAAPGAARLQAGAQMLAAVAKLNPSFRIYDVALDTDGFGLDLTGGTTGSPLSPKGYQAAGDLLVRGFDAAAQLGAGTPLAPYLPVLRQLGIADAATGKTKFHLASTMQQTATINGNDVSAWFGDKAAPGRPPLLKPANPPAKGPRVETVQRALAAAGVAVAPSGVYDPATAGAVAVFQKRNGLNISGVVDTATGRKLGLAAPPAGPPR